MSLAIGLPVFHLLGAGKGLTIGIVRRCRIAIDDPIYVAVHQHDIRIGIEVKKRGEGFDALANLAMKEHAAVKGRVGREEKPGAVKLPA